MLVCVYVGFFSCFLFIDLFLLAVVSYGQDKSKLKFSQRIFCLWLSNYSE